MGSAGRDEDERTAAQASTDRAKRDRRAEALRANLKRRKAQVRGRAGADHAPAAD